MPNLTVQKPDRRTRVGGIKSVLTVVDEPRLAITGDEVVWDGPDCAFPLSETRAGCFDVTVAAADKEADGYTILEGSIPFARYVGFECTPGPGTEFLADARAHLEAGEDRAIEAQIALWVAANDGAPGSAASVAAAIGAVEDTADSAYIGAPLVLVARADVPAAIEGGALRWDGDVLVTSNGNAAIASGEFPIGTVSAIGWPAVYGSATVAHEALDHTTNRQKAIAERVYAFAIDCTYATSVTVTAP